MCSEPGFDGALIEQFMDSSSGSARLRVAVLTDGPRLPRCCTPIVSALRRCRFIDVVAAVSLSGSDVPKHHTALTRIAGALHAVLYRLYQRAIDARAEVLDPYALVDGSGELEG